MNVTECSICGIALNDLIVVTVSVGNLELVGCLRCAIDGRLWGMNEIDLDEFVKGWRTDGSLGDDDVNE